MAKNLSKIIFGSAATVGTAGLLSLCFLKNNDGDIKIKEGPNKGVYYVDTSRGKVIYENKTVEITLTDEDFDGTPDKTEYRDDTLNLYAISPGCDDSKKRLYAEVMNAWNKENPVFGCPFRAFQYILF